MQEARQSINFDILIVGAGPAGLSTAIRLGQLAKQQAKPLSICVLEKGATVGAHLIAGAVLETRALDELIPHWAELNAPINTKVSADYFWFLNQKSHLALPTPKPMQNKNNYIISLAQFGRWLSRQAEILGVQIFTGFSAQEVLYDTKQQVIGVRTGDFGVDRNGKPKANYQAGIDILATTTVFAEGSRGSLTKSLMAKFNLQAKSDPQTYALGIKELWQIPANLHKAGTVIHTVGWPLQTDTFGGGFLYHLAPNLLAIGLAVGLDYKNTFCSPFDEFQRFKQHPDIAPLLAQGTCLEYGARVINEGGLQSIPQLTFPGGLLVGCAAGFLNVPKIKGIHTAMQSGILAADAIFNGEPETYPAKIQQSWIYTELKSVRNVRPAFKYGLWFGLAYAALDTYVLAGRAPWTLHNHLDYAQLKLAKDCKAINYPKYDNKISFDKASAVFKAHLKQDEDQPCHLTLKRPQDMQTINGQLYQWPEDRYCPAGVYDKGQITAQNCIHCKACDVKDPGQNITWLPPAGGSGPNYKML